MNSKKLQKEIIPIKGNIVVSVIYIVDEINDELIEKVEPIEDAFNLNGREIFSSIVDKHYFPSQLSYPFKFSLNGLETKLFFTTQNWPTL